jgi:hypothetical protein
VPLVRSRAGSCGGVHPKWTTLTGIVSESAVDSAIATADPGGDAEARVIAMIDAIGSIANETLPLGRSLIRLTVESGATHEPEVPLRGYRRIAWIEKAVAALRERRARAVIRVALRDSVPQVRASKR